MKNFVLIVEFTLHPGSAEGFMPLISANARESVATEPGCRQFDVVAVQGEPDRVLLYEVYDDVAAFDAHRDLPHVKAFFRDADAMIAERKMTRFDRIVDAAKPASPAT
jgi:quinol monooxygenase YgiN